MVEAILQSFVDRYSQLIHLIAYFVPGFKGSIGLGLGSVGACKEEETERLRMRILI